MTYDAKQLLAMSQEQLDDLFRHRQINSPSWVNLLENRSVHHILPNCLL